MIGYNPYHPSILKLKSFLMICFLIFVVRGAMIVSGLATFEIPGVDLAISWLIGFLIAMGVYVRDVVFGTILHS